LLYDELRVTLHKQLSDPKGQSGALPKDEGFIFCHIVGSYKLKVHHVLELFPISSKEQGSRTTPYLHEEHSKKRIQWGLVNAEAGGSSALLSGPLG
jgi:hypothetical protein